MPENTTPTIASTIGLKNVVYAMLTADTETETTYGTVKPMAGAIDASLAPQNADPDVQYYDDIEGDVNEPDPELSLTLEMADVTLAAQKEIMGEDIDDNGVLVRKSGVKRPYFAMGFKSEKADGSYRYVWLYKGRAKPMTETYHTKEGKTITRQTGKLECTFIRRTHDNAYQAIADEGQNGFTAELGATFLGAVYEPEFAAS